MGVRAPGLFDLDLPDGFRYQADVITPDAEAALVGEFARVPFTAFTMRGVSARRRVAFYGRAYDAALTDALPIPPFLLNVLEVIATWAAVDAAAFDMVLVTEYPAGAPIGWHRDAPQYGTVAGLSLLSACRMKFRPYRRPSTTLTERRTATHELTLEPRSAYLLAGASRWRYEHHIPAVDALRYSITFRTPRR
jgi:alkylated DNA repair dioxygenase AlkB